MMKTIVVGLTGQSGAGKTTVCRIFSENGYAIINADIIAREVMVEGTPCYAEILEYYGDAITDDNGKLDRQKLADIVFSNKQQLKHLNAICYPYITFEILEKIKDYSDSGAEIVLLDAPTLFESRADDFCDLIIGVVATEKNRTNRIAIRDKITIEQIGKRFASQHTERFFVNHSDYIIKNNKTMEQLEEKSLDVALKIKEYYNID